MFPKDDSADILSEKIPPFVCRAIFHPRHLKVSTQTNRADGTDNIATGTKSLGLGVCIVSL
jgi:hypothetical protein